MKPNQCRAAVLLAAGHSQIDVAIELNVHPETIRNWLKKPDFQTMLASETRIALEKVRNSSSHAFLNEMERIKKREQNHAPASTHHEKPRTSVPLLACSTGTPKTTK